MQPANSICPGLSLHIIITNPLTARVVGASQMILQPVFSIFPCSPPPSGTLQTPGLSIPWCCLPTSSSVCLVFFPLSLCFARWIWPDLMNGRHVHTSADCVSLQEVFVWSSCLLDLGTDFFVGNIVFVWEAYYLRRHLISMACIFLCSSAVRVHDSQACRKD